MKLIEVYASYEWRYELLNGLSRRFRDCWRFTYCIDAWALFGWQRGASCSVDHLVLAEQCALSHVDLTGDIGITRGV